MMHSEDGLRSNSIHIALRDFNASLRSMTQGSPIWRWAAYLVMVVFFLLILLTFRNYGIIYDEYWRSTYGDLIIQWYKTWFHNKEALTYWNLYYYGGFADVVQQLFTKISPLGVYETRHLVNAFFGLLAVIGVYKLGNILGTPFTGFLAVLFLLITPRFYGHSFNNPIDIPSAALYAISLYFLVEIVITYPKSPGSLVWKLAIALGLALAVRISSVILVVYIGIAFGFVILNQFLRSQDAFKLRVLFPSIRQLITWFLVICLLAYIIMLIFWPAAMVDPIRQPYRSLKYFSNFAYPFEVLFNGQHILNTELPWYYQIYWFLITMPEFLLLAFVVGVVIALLLNANARRLLQNLQDTRNQGMILVLVSIFAPLGITILRKPTDYDGIRHFLFVVPSMTTLAALSIGKLLEKFSYKLINYAILAGIAASMVLTIADMVRLHPDEYIYFNRLFGKGVAQASTRFDTDYWGNSYKEAVEWVEANYPLPSGSPKVKVASCLFSLSTSYYLRDDRFDYIGSYHDGQKISGTPDLFLASPRWGCNEKNSGEIIHVISRMGAPLIYIMRVSP
jgi:4-amino-4-deoxy-L-arabinose transferase-like glycosyltransferase